MGTRLECDGCGKLEPRGKEATPFKARGKLGKVRFYCGDCADRVDEYLEARDALHTELCNKYMLDHLQLHARFKAACPHGKLPDE